MSNIRTQTRDTVYIALFAALISVSSYITIPIPLVPLTAQTLVIMLGGSILNTYQAAFSVIIYLLLGVIGAPVFSHGTAGIGVILGPTGGYLIGFLLAVIVINLLKGKKNNLLRLFIANIVGGIIVVYAVGVPWLSFVAGLELKKAFINGALEFLPGDIVKTILATALGYQMNKRMLYIK